MARTFLPNGRFARTRIEPWTPERWDDGYVDNRGRFRVYRPDYPRAYKYGYCLRAHVVWWLTHGRVHRKGTELHHINQNRLDDRPENLKPLSRSNHRKSDSKSPPIPIECFHCQKIFLAPAHRIRSRPTKYCSQVCYHASERSDEHKAAITAGLKKAYAEGRR